MSFSENRERNKRLYGQYLNKLTSSPKYLSKLKKGYKVVQYESKFKHEVLQILAYAFSSIGGTNHAKVLQISVKDHYDILSSE